MLQLQQTLTGYPAAGVQYLLLANASLLLYFSADSVIILNAHTLALVRVLAFWEAFPGTIHNKENISCLSVDSGMKLIIAATKSRLAAWSLSDTQRDTWRIHSTLLLPENHNVTTLDIKAGLLAVGCENQLSVYTLLLENDLPTWSKKWAAITSTPILLNFAPSLMYIATASTKDNAVRLYSTTSGRQTQVIPHPRPVIKLSWRRSQASSRDDLTLYSVTSDATLRIFFPVLDAPDYLQLHASLDLYSSRPFSVVGQPDSTSSVFWLDRKTVEQVATSILSDATQVDEARNKLMKEIKDDGWDLFLRVLGDGSIVVTAVANIDSRPPTLLQHFTVQQSQPSIFTSPPSYLYILPNPNPAILTLLTCPPLMSMDLAASAFFDAQSHGLQLNSLCLELIPEEKSEIIRFIRTPEGKGVGALRVGGGGEIWKIKERGTKLIRSGSWDQADFVVVLADGHAFATYSKSTGLVKLHSSPPQTLLVPNIESLFTMPSSSRYEFILGITANFSIVQIQATDTPSLTIIGQHRLPLAYTPRFILPVDPMAWGSPRNWAERDVLLSISEGGEITFWVPEANAGKGWRRTRIVRTGRSGFRKVRCSSAKKTALIVESSQGDELTIWDSLESEFSSGLEYCGESSELILDLDWSSTPDMQSILAVGYAHRVDILCQQRMTYFAESPGWGLCRTIDISSFTPYPISDSIWLAHGSFLIAAGQQMYLFSEPPSDQRATESLLEYVARQNGPLDDYHPQMLLQCLIWDKIELVKEIIVNMARAFLNKNDKPNVKSLPHLPVERFFQTDQPSRGRVDKQQYNLLFNGTMIPSKGEDNEITFSRSVVTQLIESLESHQLSDLSPNEQAHLIVLIQATLDIDEQRRALDSNGLRYLISMKSFYIINSRTTVRNTANGAVPKQSARRERLRYRDMIWAFHSESQELLLEASTAACSGRMTWSDARALGLAIWLNSGDSLKAQFEVIARNEYMAGDVRDPTACSLFYFALGKVKLVQGLWRQAAWHREQTAMLKFLGNDFTTPRWRTAALKNAFALLSKQRFEYAAAFFLLGGSLRDAVNVCIKQLGDFQLAVALARIVEQSSEGQVLQGILKDTVLPIAFELGNRWLGSWAFWLLHRRDLAVRVLLTPLQDISTAFNLTVTAIGEPHYDDPGLALLFSQLRSKTLQAAKGTSEISGRAEFNFVLQMARVFCRMGCHVLALDLVRSWSFPRPSTAIPQSRMSSISDNLVSPIPSRPLFPLEPALRRRSSIMIDMDITSLPPTRLGSPNRPASKNQQIETIPEESDFLARQAGLGNLMKSAKHDVKVPEFDMSAFF